MSVLVSPKRGVTKVRRRRQSLAAPVEERGADPRLQRARETAVEASSADVPLSRRRQELGRQHDQAQYTCQCGFVFEAPVSTSVGCPHCGGTQAW
jgi:hypothetical protein